MLEVHMQVLDGFSAFGLTPNKTLRHCIASGRNKSAQATVT